MKANYIAILLMLFTTSSLFSQSKLNNYKYVIVPNKYDFLKENDQYQLHSLTEFLFNKYGFKALMEGSKYPDDLLKNRCLALKSNLIKDSGMFKTKLAIELKNCDDQVVFTSNMGESREKEYNRAYTEALRAAFESVAALNYKYEPSTLVATTTIVEDKVIANEVSKEIQQLKEEIQNLKKEKETVIVNIPVKEVPAGVLYAQAVENGFQLVDSAPKIVCKIKKTGIADVFLVENKNATLYKKDNKWILEYYENNVLKQEVLNIKF